MLQGVSVTALSASLVGRNGAGFGSGWQDSLSRRQSANEFDAIEDALKPYKESTAA